VVVLSIDKNASDAEWRNLARQTIRIHFLWDIKKMRRFKCHKIVIVSLSQKLSIAHSGSQLLHLLFNAALMFSFFLPKSFSSHTADKYKQSSLHVHV
jgi:hypothetical protein